MRTVTEVTELVYSPVHTAPLTRIKLPSGDSELVVATEGISVGSTIAIVDNVPQPGNVTSLQTFLRERINNVEIRPGDGGKLSRTAGNACIVEARLGDKVRIRLPSGKSKELNGKCRATTVPQDMDVLRCCCATGAAHYKAKARGKLSSREWCCNDSRSPHGRNHQAVHGQTLLPGNASWCKSGALLAKNWPVMERKRS